jgi:hypothetical protein
MSHPSRSVRQIGWFLAADLALILFLIVFGLLLHAVKIPVEGHPFLTDMFGQHGLFFNFLLPVPRQNDDQPLNQQLANRAVTLLKTEAQYLRVLAKHRPSVIFPPTLLLMAKLSGRPESKIHCPTLSANPLPQ